MSSWKRSIAGLLVAVMLLSSLPSAAFATALEETDAPTLLEQAAAPDAANEAEAAAPDAANEAEAVAPDATGEAEAVAPDVADETLLQSATVSSGGTLMASTNSDLKEICEIGYRFGEDGDWNLIGVQTNDKTRSFDDNGNYAIKLEKEKTAFPLKVYVMVWNANGESQAYPKENSPFEVKDATDAESIEIKDGDRSYTLSFYAPWLETFSYSGESGNANYGNSIGKSVVISDKNWYHTHSADGSFFLENNAHSVELQRDEQNLYENPFPYTLTFYEPENADEDFFQFKDPDPNAGVTLDKNAKRVTFHKSGESVTVNGYKFTLTDPASGEVTFEGVKGASLEKKTLGRENALSENEDYEVPQSNKYTLKLGAEDKFPFYVKFTLRGQDASQDIFQGLKEGVAEADADDSSVVIFKRDGASVKVGEYAFEARDERAGEIQYAFGAGTYANPNRVVTVGASADAEKESPLQWNNKNTKQTGYVKVDGKSHTIVLRDTDTFSDTSPVQITFTATRDALTELKAKAGDGAKVLDRAEDAPKNQVTVEFSKQDASATIGNYTFTVHSPFVGATLYTVVNGGSSKIVVNDENYANAWKDARTAYDAARKAFNEAQKAKEDAQNVIAETPNKRKEAEEARAEAQEKRDKAQKPCDDAKTDRNAKLAAFNEAEKALDATPVANAEAQNKFDKAKSKLDEAQKTLDEAQKALDEAQSKLDEIEKNFKEAQEIVNKSPDVLKEAEEALEKAKTVYYNVGKSSKDTALFEKNACVIELDEGEYFPCEVTFQKWDEKNGWNIPPGDGTPTESVKETRTFEGVNSTFKVFGNTFSVHAYWLEEIRYCLKDDDKWVTVGNDATKEKAGVYELFDADGAFVIDPHDPNGDILFPYTMTFSVRNASGSSVETQQTFKDAEDEVTVRNHAFKLKVNPHRLEEVKYQFNDKDHLNENAWVTVGLETAKAKAGKYELFDENGAFAIDPPDDIIFPCTVTFRTRNPVGEPTDTEAVLQNTDSTVTIKTAQNPPVEHEFSFRKNWKTEIVYALTEDGDVTKTGIVCPDEKWATAHDNYDAVSAVYDKDNPKKVIRLYYVINADNVSFPVKVEFRLRGSEKVTKLEFKSPDDEQKYQGVYFSVHPTWLDEVSYTLEITSKDSKATLHDRTITVGADKEKAEAAEKAAKNVTAEQLAANPLLSVPDYRLAPDEGGVIEIALPRDTTIVDEEGNSTEVNFNGAFDDIFYPYGIKFQYSRLKKADEKLIEEKNPTSPVKIWFESPDDVRTVGAYKFKVTSKRTDPNKLVSAGLWLGAKLETVSAEKPKDTGNSGDTGDSNTAGDSGDTEIKRTAGKYVPFVRMADAYYDPNNPYAYYDPKHPDWATYWGDKKAQENYEASLQSLLPLRESYLYANLTGFSKWEVENAQLVFVTSSDTGKLSAKQAVAWSETLGLDSSGDYSIVENYALMKDKKSGEPLINGDGIYEMIVGQLNQINDSGVETEDIRYIVQVVTDDIDLYDGLNMKISYADEERGGILVKGNRFWGRDDDRHSAVYVDPETKKETRIGAYRFTVNEQWQDGEAFLAMWPSWIDGAKEDTFKAAYKGLTPAIYEGAYLTTDALNKAGSKAVDITSVVWGQELDMQPAKLRYKTNLVAGKTEGAPYFTLVWLRDGVPVQVMPFQVLVNVVKDDVWMILPWDEREEDEMPTDRSELGLPKTHYERDIKDEEGNAKTAWEFGAGDQLNGADEEINAEFFEKHGLTPETVYDNVEMRYYKVPDVGGFNGVAMDRFYVSALSYTHHVKVGETDKNGVEVKTPLTESTLKMPFPEDATVYSGKKFYESPKDAKEDADRGNAVKSRAYVDGAYYSVFQDDKDETPLAARYIYDTNLAKTYHITVYAGSKPYDTLDAAKADKTAEDVTAQIFTATGYGAEYSKTVYFTFFNAEGKRFDCYGIHIQSVVQVEYGPLTLNGDKNFKPNPPTIKTETDEKTGLNVTTYVYAMPATYPETGRYSMRVRYERDFKELTPKEEDFTILVSEADLSKLTFEEAFKRGKDVTLSAIQDPGYSDDYSNGVRFYVYNAAKQLIDYSIVITEPFVESPKSKDTYFHMERVSRTPVEDDGSPDRSMDEWTRLTQYYSGFAMPYTADSYYIHGYQTFFLMDVKKDEEGRPVGSDGTPLGSNGGDLIGEPVYVPVQAGAEFYPVFEQRDKTTTIYGMLDDCGEIQKSGKNLHTFSDPTDASKEIPSTLLNYSAAAANGTHLKNYWVTFLTQQTGKAELFVNTANDESHWRIKKDANGKDIYQTNAEGKKTPVYETDENGQHIIEREVFINDAAGAHDIFFANIGDQKLENIQVTLSNEDAVYLDDYWKVPLKQKSAALSDASGAGDATPPNRYLKPYGSVETKDYNGETVEYGGIPNIAKIRIFAKNPEEAKSINADLTISGTYQDPDTGERKNVSRTIHLSGMVGDVRIVGESNVLRHAVKWVPYANLISTNNIYGGSTVRFEITGGKLPEGMELRPNGEIYGTPMEATPPNNPATFTVTATFQYGDATSADSKKFTLEVLSNDDENVWKENDWNKPTNNTYENETEDEANVDGHEENGNGQYFGVEYWIPDISIDKDVTEVAFDHGEAYRSEKSADGPVDGAPLSDERRSRNAEKVTQQNWKKYRDVEFSFKNYASDNLDGEEDFDWFIDLWLNGKRLKGICLEEGQKFTEEMRSVYDFYYWRGSLHGVATGEAIEANSNKDGNSNNTVAGEFRHSADTSQTQYTTAGNYKVNDKNTKSSGGKSGGGSNSGSGGSGGSGGGNSGSGGSGSSSRSGSSSSSSRSGSSSNSDSGHTSSTPAPKTYAVTVSDVSNGTVKVSATKAAEGAKVTVTATPNQGYALDAITVKTSGKKGTKVSVSGSGNSRTFTMPKAGVTVSATFFKLYNVRPLARDFGWLEVSQENYVLPGTKVTITAHPEAGYKAVNIRAYDSEGKLIEVKDNGDGTATFTMPSGGGVEASADFEPKTEEELLAELMEQFTDVKPSDWFYKDAAWAVGRGIMNGVTPTTWVPQDNISTATVVRTLFRLSMSDKDDETRDIILGEYASDIYAENRPWLPDSSAGYYREARWAAANNILTENVFTGNAPISRAKFAVILRNYLRYRSVQVEISAPSEFSDIAVIETLGDELGENLNEAFQILRAADVFRGDSSNAMLPGNNSTRAHMAALLHRLADFIGEYEKRWSEEPQESDEQTEES